MEQLKHRNDIEIKLLANRRFIYVNRKQSIVVTAEHLATEVTVLFPDEYEDYSKRVDFVNSQGKEWTEGLYTPEFKHYKPGTSKTRFHFSLPVEVTTEGELKMQFLAYKTDNSMTTVPFEVIPIYVQNGMLAFKRSAKNNPDLLILSANQSAQALFNSQKAIAKVEDSLIISKDASFTAKEAKDTSIAAFDVSKDAMENSERAVEVSQSAEEKSDIASATAAEAKAESEESLAASEKAEANSANAMTTALEAKNESQAARERAAEAHGYSLEAKSNSESAVQSAEKAADFSKNAKENSESALEAASEALEIANEAKIDSQAAIRTADQANETAISAEEFAKSVVERANAGEFKGEKGEVGEMGPPGKDGIMFATDNLVGFHIDENGGFYALAGDASSVDFRYDEETGELFLVYGK